VEIWGDRGDVFTSFETIPISPGISQSPLLFLCSLPPRWRGTREHETRARREFLGVGCWTPAYEAGASVVPESPLCSLARMPL